MFLDLNRDKILKASTGFIILVMYLFQAFATRGLYADGSFQLLNLLHAETGKTPPDLFHELVTRNNEPLRFFAYILAELPTVLALRLGVTNLTWLTYLFSSWLLAIPLVFWGLSLWRLRDDFLFWPFVLLFTVIYFNGNFFIIGEYNVAYGLSACCLAYLLKEKNNTRTDNMILLAAAAGTVMSYGSTLLTGPLLCALSLRQFLQVSAVRTKIYWGALAAIFATSFAVGAWGYMHPQLPENLKNARNPQILFHDAQFIFALLYAALVLSHLRIRGKWRDVQALLLPAVCFFFFLIPLNAPPYMSYQVRAFTGLALCVLIAAYSIFEIYGKRLQLNSGNPETLKHLAIPVFALLVTFAVADIQNSWAFRNYISDFRHVVNSRTGLIPFERSVMFIRNNDLYGWTWTYPSMGLLLREHANAAVIKDPVFQEGQWRPFDPAAPPDLSRYHP